jgi:predicted  nucleic acid-binding Zn-ribbon protein
MGYLQNLESDMFKYDLSLGADTLGFYYDKGLTALQVDVENDISRKERQIAGLSKYLDKLVGSMTYQQQSFGSIEPGLSNKYSKSIEKLEKLQDELAGLIESLEARIEKRENGFEQFSLASEDGFVSIGKEIQDFLELYIDKLSADEQATVFHLVELLHEEKEISWYHYLTCGVALTYRLAKSTKKDAGWWDLCTRLRRNRAKYQQGNKEVLVDLDSRVFGEMNFPIEEAIDEMRSLRKVADWSGWSVLEVAAGLS